MLRSSPSRLTVALSADIITDSPHKSVFNYSQTPTPSKSTSKASLLDTLKFVDSQPYADRLAQAKEKSGATEAVQVGTATLNGHPIALAVMDFAFMAGSMGSVVGERLTLLIEYAIKHSLPLLLVATSGRGLACRNPSYPSCRWQKQAQHLPKCTNSVCPTSPSLPTPTTGGVTASFASLADIIIAEPNALICFAGPRIIEQTLGRQLPPEAQKSEFLLQHGMIDCIVHRQDLKEKVAEFSRLPHNPFRGFP